MKRILIVSEVFYPENGLINDFANELVRRGYRVEVLTQHPSYPLGRVFEGYRNEKYRIEKWNGIVIHRFRLIEGYCESKLKKILNYYQFVRGGNRIVKKIGGDYDHVLVYQTGPLTVALPGVTAKKKFGVPLTVWTFDIWPDAVYAYGFPRVFPLTAFLNRLIKKIYAGSDHILVSSDDFKEVIARYVPSEKRIDYAPNWLVEEKREKAVVRLDRARFNFTFAGNISLSQNLENVLRGWEKCGLEQAVLNIVGDGSRMAVLRELVAKRNIANVVFHGRHPSSQIADILSQSDVLVLPLVADEGIRRTEPFKLQSYLSAGKPILGILNGAGHKIIESYRLGISVSPDDIRQIAEGFKKVSALTETEKAAIGRQAHRVMTSRFDRTKIIDRVICCIENRDGSDDIIG